MTHHKIILGDCLEGMKTLEPVDLIIGDPPYNAKDIGWNKKVYSHGPMQLPENEYKEFCLSWFSKAQRLSDNIVLTPGIANVCTYPQPHWIVCWHKPAAVSFNRMGGYNAWEPIMIYGKPSKRLGQDYIKIHTLNFNNGPESKHPCPKVADLYRWIVEHFSKEGDIILDPFAGSFTTSKVAKDLNRNSISIEINPEYWETIGKKRLRFNQPSLDNSITFEIVRL